MKEKFGVPDGIWTRSTTFQQPSATSKYSRLLQSETAQSRLTSIFVH